MSGLKMHRIPWDCIAVILPLIFHCFIPSRGAKYCDQYVCVSIYLSVCSFIRLSVHSHISKTTRPNFTKFSVHVTYWPRFNASLTALQQIMCV